MSSSPTQPIDPIQLIIDTSLPSVSDSDSTNASASPASPNPPAAPRWKPISEMTDAPINMQNFTGIIAQHEHKAAAPQKRGLPSPAWVKISDAPGGLGAAMAMAMSGTTPQSIHNK